MSDYDVTFETIRLAGARAKLARDAKFPRGDSSSLPHLHTAGPTPALADDHR